MEPIENICCPPGYVGPLVFFFFFFGIKVYCPQLSYKTYTWNLYDSPHYGPYSAYYKC